jgi:hypothetical protein
LEPAGWIFEGFWWQDIEKMKEAYRMLDLEITQKGGIKIHDLITSEYVEDQLKMYALQSLSNAPRTGTYDLEFLHSLENMYLKAGLDYSETDHTIDKKGLEALKECYKNIKLKKSGDWLERGGGDIIAGVTLIAGGMVMSRAGNRSLKIRSEGIGNAGSSKTYSVKRGPKLQGERFSSKKASGAGTEIGKHSVETLNRDQTRIVVENLLDNGEISLKDLQNMVPEGTPNTFKPTDTMKNGAKYEFQLSDGQKAIIRWHEPDPVAAAKFPNSASGSRWTAQIKIGNKQVTVDGLWTKKQNLNEVHVPIQGR